VWNCAAVARNGDNKEGQNEGKGRDWITQCEPLFWSLYEHFNHLSINGSPQRGQTKAMLASAYLFLDLFYAITCLLLYLSAL
jgi:hypothetical protein